MGEHREGHMVVPAGICPYFIVRHPELRFPFFKTLFDCPPDTTEPDQRAEGDTHRRITDRIGVGRLGASGPLDHEPDGAVRQPVLT
jgi:hypothetical protein